MDHHSVQQGLGVLLLLLSLSAAMMVVNRGSSGVSDLSLDASRSSAGSSSSSSSYEMGAADRRRQLLQTIVTPAPAPAPASSAPQTYISYGALTAGYVPCPPQTGRSYYTNNCQSATGAVSPYTRGCSAISMCTRS